ncbi:hypothetical protein J437_LFUL018533 [Ladona fulva]|uniref:Reverse transcriptase domain-containing protein n=1 Tax=Ladona fulva TaxID=123851 RepID=A0A8K0PBG0_LADFU|nr:hypothetical protein J437_LFUL018533 [Ladona fulva]
MTTWQSSRVSTHCIYIAIMCIRNKVLDSLCLENKYDILCLNEHWLKSPEVNLYNISGYQLASVYCREDNKNGGVVVYVKDNLHFSVIDVSTFCSELNFEMVAIFVKEYEPHYIALPMETFCDKLEQVLELFVSSRKNVNIILCADLHVDMSLASNTTCTLSNLLSSFNLHCSNYKPTRLAACLDNIITDLDVTNYEVRTIDPAFSDHLALTLNVSVSSSDRISMKGTECALVRPITPAGLLNLNITWFSLLKYNEEENFKIFFSEFMGFFDMCFPKKFLSISARTPKMAYVTPDILQIKEKLVSVQKSYRSNSNKLNKELLTKVQNEYNLLLTQAKRVANLEYISNSDNKLKAAWKFIKKEAGITKTSPHLSISPCDLNNFFIETVENITSTTSSDKAKAISLSISWKWVTPYEIHNVIKSLKNSNSKDIYSLSNNLLKSLNEFITEPLSIIINTCLQSGVFPHHLKYSKVTPVYKKGPKDDPNSYRPISVIPIIGKIFEAIIKSQLYDYLENNSYFSSSQYGFRKGKTTSQALQHITNIILNSYEDQLSVALTLCDLTKAFDCVSHSILLEKLKCYGISGVKLSLFQSYLSQRQQCVEIEGVQSSSLPIIII